MTEYKDRWDKPLVNPAITEEEFESRKVITGIDTLRPETLKTTAFDDYKQRYED